MTDMQSVFLDALAIVREVLNAAPNETTTQAALRCVSEFLATDAPAPQWVIRRTMVALTLGVSSSDQPPLWASVFAAAELAKRLPHEDELTSVRLRS